MDDEAEDDFEDSDYPEQWDDDDPSDVVDCPACGAEVYEQAEQCPACGEYIIHETNLWSDRPVIWIVLGLLGIFAVVYVLIFGV